MEEWQLTDEEWAATGSILTGGSAAAEPKPGRPRLDVSRAAAEACLYHHFASRAPVRHSFGWNNLPREFGVSPATANRRYREWLATGAWCRFWDALVAHRRRSSPRAAGSPPLSPPPPSLLGSPVRAVVEELERAFCFFNDRFFAGSLPTGVVITLEDRPRSRRLGSFCGHLWADGACERHLIVVNTTALARGPEGALGTLLHEIVHLRNYAVGLSDCSRSQYHNRHFRDAALLTGLECAAPTRAFGYAATRLSERGRAAVADFRWRDESVFDALLEPPTRFTRPPVGCGQPHPTRPS